MKTQVIYCNQCNGTISDPRLGKSENYISIPRSMKFFVEQVREDGHYSPLPIEMVTEEHFCSVECLTAMMAAWVSPNIQKEES